MHRQVCKASCCPSHAHTICGRACAGTWAYVTTVLATLTYTSVPFVSLVWGAHPTTINGPFALAATLNFVAGAAVNFHVRKLGHVQGMWLSLVSNHLLAFTFFKAMVNTLLCVRLLQRCACSAA